MVLRRLQNRRIAHEIAYGAGREVGDLRISALTWDGSSDGRRTTLSKTVAT